MKRILIGVLLLAVVGSATVLTAQTSRIRYLFRGSNETAAVQFDSGEQKPDGTLTIRNMTLTIGDFVISADDATFEGPRIVKLGANARISMPPTR